MKVDEATRRQLRLGMASAGTIPEALIPEIVDIAAHAAETAMAQLIQIALETHPDRRVGIAVAGPAMGLLAAMVAAGIEGLKKFGSAEGLACGEIKIGGAA